MSKVILLEQALKENAFIVLIRPKDRKAISKPKKGLYRKRSRRATTDIFL
jgi:hypothetical protein